MAAGLTLEHAAAGICSLSYLSLIEAGKRKPSKRVETLLSDRYGLRSFETQIFEQDPGFRSLKNRNFDPTNEASLTPTVLELRRALSLEQEGAVTAAIVKFMEIHKLQSASLELRIYAATSLIRALKLKGDFYSARGIGEAAMADFQPFKGQLPVEYCTLVASLAGAVFETGAQHLALQMLDDVMPLAKSHPALQGPSLWAMSELLGSLNDFAGAATYASDAVEKFTHAGDEYRAALLENNRIWFSLLSPLSDQQVTKNSIENLLNGAREIGDRELITNAKINYCLFEIRLGDIVEATVQLRALAAGVSVEEKPTSPDQVAQICALAIQVNELDIAKTLLIVFDEAQGDGAELNTYRLMAEVAEKLGHMQHAVKYWRTGAQLSGWKPSSISPKN
jgi:hypothetical protein